MKKFCFVIIAIIIGKVSYGKVDTSMIYQIDTNIVLLNESIVSGNITDVNSSPLRLKSISKEEIGFLSPAKTFPELLKNTPGLFATSESGSYGDAKVNIRGFKQENISVLLNGVPISGLTSGNMFWNNWMGLSDATYSIQLQKGIGGSMLSDNSVGGTINISTINPSPKPSVGVGYYHTDYGTSKTFLSLESGDLPKGWGLSLSASYVWGGGFVEATDVRSWAYLLSLRKRINSKNIITFTALGSPERHQQRSVRLTYDEVEKYGVGYNKNWGWYNDEKKTISENNYFKPYFTLNHNYNTMVGSDKNISFSLNNAAYFAIGDGGGIWTESKGRRIISYQKKGHIDWNSVISDNNSEDNPTGSAKNILSDYMAGHTQFGLKSNVVVDFNPKITLDAGLHYQMYNTWEKERITDLLGADHWYEEYSENSLAGVAGRDPYKKVGDYIRVDNGKIINYLTIYALSTFKAGTRDNFVFKLGGSLSVSTHKRWDKYNYIENIYSDLAIGMGGSIKGGFLYKVNRNNSLYINGAAYSRAPYTNIYFASGNNSISKGVKNENNFLGELGYRFVSDRGGMEFTLYSAYWKNKTLMSDPYKPLDMDSYRYMVSGLDAFHYGGEFDAFYRFGRWLQLNVFASIGEWKWKNDVSATIYDPYSGQEAQKINIYSHNLSVGDAPQTQVGASFNFHPLRIVSPSFRNERANVFFNNADFYVRMDWSYNDRYWADFDPITRKNPEDRSNSYRLPSYHLINLSINWDQLISKSIIVSLFFNMNNLADAKYVERGKDGATHDRDSFSGYWGAPRNYNFGVRLKF